MTDPLSPPLHRAAKFQAVPTATPATAQPSLGQRLEPARQQQLAQCLANLIHRRRQAAVTPTPETAHEES